MARFDYDMAIIGGGAAGLTVASGSAQLGAKTLLIENEPKLGGDCLHFGCVPSKTLIHTASVYHAMKNAAAFGLPSIEPPPVDFRKISARIREVIDSIQEHDSEERFCSLGALVKFGQAEFVDEHTVMLGGERITSKHWVIATGSSPYVPDIDGLSSTPYLTNRQLFSMEKLPASMIILGGGPIGIEMAQAFGRLGTKVTVVQKRGQILDKEDSDLAGIVMSIMASEGVKFHLNSEVLKVRDVGVEREVHISTGGQMITLRAEALLVASGRVANVRGLGLDKAGVKFTPRGIGVDSRMRTSQKHIFAAGDVTGAYQFTHAAGYEGSVVVSNAIFRLPRRADYANFPWCTYTDPELASIGMNEKRAAAAGVKYTAWSEEFRTNDRSLAEGCRLGRIRMLVSDKGAPIGIQILGPHAGELISEWVAVMNSKMKLSTLASSVHPYPTLGEINKRVAGSMFASKIFSDKVRAGLKLFFNYKGRACKQ